MNGLIGVWTSLALLIGSAYVQEIVPTGGAPGLGALSTFTVNSPMDAADAAPGDGVCATADSVCTLRAAIQEANALIGDDIINLPAGTFTLTRAGSGEDASATGDLDITSNLSLSGSGEATVIDANWADRGLHVVGAYAVNLSGVTITHGNGNGGGIRNDGGTLAITNSVILDNNAASSAGGILNSGALTITHSTVSDNNAGADAGGILNSGTLVLADSLVSNNNAGADAGGILNSGTLTLANSAFSTNNAGADGGGILNLGTLVVTNGFFLDNNTRLGGGGIFSSGVLTVSRGAFSLNNAGSGGGVYDGGGTIDIAQTTFSGNSASTGGGILTRFDVTIANSTFSDNSAGSGDDIYTASGTLAITNSTIFGAVSDPEDIDAGTVSPAGSGSGVYNLAGGGGSVTLRNTIVAGHDSGGNCVGVITNGGHNLEDGATCNWGSANNSLSGADPLLGAGTGNPAYFPLLAGSPAIDAGNNATCLAAPVSTTSQNGVVRPTDGDRNGTETCDIGAFERPGGSWVFLPQLVK